MAANGHKHEHEGRALRVTSPLDMFSSGPWFDGWRETLHVAGLEAHVRPIASPHTWLLAIGWRRHGLLSLHERAATA